MSYTRVYSNFVGADVSSDPKAIELNRLTECVNMWRDYDSQQGEAVETFPGFRAVAQQLGGGKSVHGMYHFRDRNGDDYIVVHAGTELYSFKARDLSESPNVLNFPAPILSGKLADQSSTGFLYNNNLYILDGANFVVVSGAADGNTSSITASEINAYIPTTYFNGKPYEQRNMLSEYADETFCNEQYIQTKVDFDARSYLNVLSGDGYLSVYGIKNEYSSNAVLINQRSNVYFTDRAFENQGISTIDIICSDLCDFGMYAFKNCTNLRCVYIKVLGSNPVVRIGSEAFKNTLLSTSMASFVIRTVNEVTIEGDKDGLFIQENRIEENQELGNPTDGFDSYVIPTELVTSIDRLTKYDTHRFFSEPKYIAKMTNETINGQDVGVIRKIYFNSEQLSAASSDGIIGNTTFRFKLHPTHFSTIENVDSFLDGNPDFRKTGLEAINGCRKSAVFDGRIFLTGNPDLPNTVFYSNRNNTGANDPTYFGAYNYFNDGVGNTPNVELLATPTMLMVLKNNTVQDGSIYYHQGAYNTDEFSKDLVPRIYPSVAGATGIGSAGKVDGGVTCCNFLDDPVFLTQRGLDCVGKETVNLERTVMHRSSNVDRLLKSESLADASMTEWKGYLVILVSGRAYLADSRRMFRHEDGSYQYEWFCLDDLGVWSEYRPRYKYLKEWPIMEDGYSLGDYWSSAHSVSLREHFKLKDTGDIYPDQVRDNVVIINGAMYAPGEGMTTSFQYVEEDDGDYVVINEDNEQMPAQNAEFCPGCRVLVVGDYLFFGTTNGTLCLVNTDKRDASTGRIGRDWYTHNNVAYTSGCATRLDDCDQKSLAKMTVCGTSVMMLKTLDGARCTVNISINGRDWRKLKVVEASGSVFSFDDMDFSNFSFSENEVNIVKLPELTRNWVHKQYYVYSDGFKEPFGLYSISYLYKTKGKIRRL